MFPMLRTEDLRTHNGGGPHGPACSLSLSSSAGARSPLVLHLAAAGPARPRVRAASSALLACALAALAPFPDPPPPANVSRSGALVPLSTRALRFQKLLVPNLQTNEDALCRVAR